MYNASFSIEKNRLVLAWLYHTVLRNRLCSVFCAKVLAVIYKYCTVICVRRLHLFTWSRHFFFLALV
ncbi:hypothetical protein L1887_05496 [Cichorium endivia]|nr:hypothetical protein L1887_05496 [Cichorium endivia]